jgi:hypothetical protein
MWIRETQEDLTAAEFATSLDLSLEEGRKRKRAVDYDKLLLKLDRRMLDMGCESEHGVFQKPPSGKGMSSIVYNQEQREALFA